MQAALVELAKAHEYIWPFMLAYFWVLSKRLRNLERTNAALVAQVAILIKGHRLSGGENDGSIRLYPD